MNLVNYFSVRSRGISGIYRIRNLVNNKFYIGSSNNLYKRYIQHKVALERNEHHSKYLQNSYNKYGSFQFIMEVLFLCKQEFLLYYEQLLIHELQPTYNMNKKAASNRGYKWSKESRKKLSLSQMGNKYNLGHKKTKETREKISKSRKGKCCGEENGFFGKHHSLEVKEKIRQSRIGKKHSQETKNKMAKSRFKPVRIKDTIYESLKAACKDTRMDKATLGRWCRNKNKIDYAFV